ncbi:MAG: hypothetical protein R6X22_05275 [Gemmatimonadota bacterium]
MRPGAAVRVLLLGLATVGLVAGAGVFDLAHAYIDTLLLVQMYLGPDASGGG